MNFHDKIVLVTGGTGGLGREVTMAFLEAGATVIVTYRARKNLPRVMSAARSASAQRRLRAMSVDVTDAPAVEKFVADIVAKHGRLDILVNTVGGYAGGTNLWEVGPADLRPDAAAQSEGGICSGARRRAADDPAEAGMDREHRVEGRVGPRRGRGALCGVESGRRWRCSIRSPRK